MWSTRYSCHVLIKLEFSWQIFEKSLIPPVVRKIEVCTGRNLEFYPARPGPARPGPRSIPSGHEVFLQKCSHNRRKSNCNPLYLKSSPTVVSLVRVPFNVQTIFVNELFSDYLRASEIVLAFDERYRGIVRQCVLLSRTLPGMGQSGNRQRKSNTVFVSWARRKQVSQYHTLDSFSTSIWPASLCFGC